MSKTHTIQINGITHDGQGVGRIDGMTVFVEGALPDETVLVQIVELKKSYVIAKLICVLAKSLHRVTPPCAYYTSCGGCNLQHASYDQQLKIKHQIVADTIKKLGGINEIKIYPTIGMKTPFHYRNRVQFHFGNDYEDKLQLGFYRPKTHEVVDNRECCIQSPTSIRIRDEIKKIVEQYNIPVYDSSTKRGLVKHVVIHCTKNTDEIMVALVLNKNQFPFKKEFCKLLTSKFPNIRSVVVSVNTSETNLILGNNNLVVYGDNSITERILGLDFKFSVSMFFQINSVQTEQLYNKILDYAGLDGTQIILDLYCGVGTISIVMATRAQHVYGVEEVKESVQSAAENAKLNGIKNVDFIQGKAEEVITDIMHKGINADVVVVDPPRKGCAKSLLECIARMSPPKLIYVSCNPSTLSRDLKILAQLGYFVLEVQPIDMFPFTSHVETVVLMSRVKD